MNGKNGIAIPLGEIVSKMKPKSEKSGDEPKEESGEHDSAEVRKEAARAVLDAIKADDAEAFVAAYDDFCELSMGDD